MGLMDFIKKQFVDVIEWTEPEDGILSARYPMQDNEIQNNAKLTVRETQLAMFVNEGKVADVFGPGMYTLNTQTLPVLTYLQNWDKFFASPFKSDVYFFSTRDQLDQKWGTATPITVRDKEFGALRIRANGIYTYALKDPKAFYQKVSGTRETVTVNEMEGQLRSVIMTELASFLGNGDVAFLDMAANQKNFSETLYNAVAPALTPYGLELKGFLVQSISLPEELQKYLDKSSSMRLVGDLQKYAMFQAGDSLSIAAGNEGGVAGAGAGIGAGMAMGQMMGNMLQGIAGGNAKPASQEDMLATLERLHGMVQKGILTQAEFDAKKAEILSSMK
ncbi:MAG: SPFH domain-containing protein [Alphaproteobacteria bacterium]|nr:SPFH domain-containing protein [Alphaproteobacteria bacterium]